MKFNSAAGVVALLFVAACGDDLSAPRALSAPPGSGISASATLLSQTKDGLETYTVRLRGQSAISAYQGRLSFGAGSLSIVSTTAGTAQGQQVLVNTAGEARGEIRFAGYAPGALNISGDGLEAFRITVRPARAKKISFSTKLEVVGSNGVAHLQLAPSGAAVDTVSKASGANLCATVLWGDVDADGALNILDAQQIARYSVNLSVVNTTAVSMRGDLTADGVVNINDAQQAARYAVGLSTGTARPGSNMNVPASITVVVLTPGATFAGLNLPVQLGAQVQTEVGVDISSCASVTWSSSDVTKATISGDGTITAVASGTPTFTATSGSVSSQLAFPIRVPAVTSFSATPNTISSGHSVTLSWTTSEAATCSIDQGVGAVPCSGSALVTPAAATTYRLTATAGYGASVAKTVSVSVTAAAAEGWGVIGDSGADEYRADDNRGGAYASTTLNWVELLVKYRQLNFGTWGARDNPRRSGYEYNWARSGATSYTVISAGQHTGLAAQIRAGLVRNVIMQIGANDFSKYNIYDDIYNGTLAGTALQAELDRIYSNITLALQTVKDAGAANILWITAQDRGIGGVYLTEFPDATKRALVTAAVTQVNDRVKQFAAARGIVAIDFASIGTGYAVDALGMLHVGAELIDGAHPGDEPHHAILGDAEHLGTVVEGILANALIEAMRTRAMNITTFSSTELLRNAGIAQ